MLTTLSSWRAHIEFGFFSFSSEQTLLPSIAPAMCCLKMQFSRQTLTVVFMLTAIPAG